MSESLNAMNCTTCGGTLPALAGHKAKSLICSYCGSVMDRHDGFKVLAQYRDMKRPAGPFRLGMTGEIMDVEHTVVGIVGVKTQIDGVGYGWTNYQMYSPTHGYSWMTWNDGHLTHSRKVRDANDHDQSSFAARSEFTAMGRTFRMYETYNARVTYIEGELTWVPKLGDTVGVIDGIDPPYGFAMSRTAGELELEMQTYLDRDAVLESFGIDDEFDLPGGVHAIQPFDGGKIHTSLAAAAKWFVPIAAVGAIGMMMFGGGSKVAEATIADTAKGGEITFEAPSANRLMSIEMTSNLNNQWAWYEMSLTHKESGEVVEFGEGMNYYSGRSGGESWSEGSRAATIRFQPPKAGTYTLRVANPPLDPKDATLSQTDRKQYAGNKPVKVEVRKNVFVSRYFWILAAITGLIYGSFWLRRSLFEGKRWAGGGDDDDD